jgi:glucose-1-phosphate thymidylyltransferase
MTQSLKIVIPTAGFATRMRPQTWSKPKPLVSVAGRTALDHLLDTFRSVPEPQSAEYVIIFSPGLGETQIPLFMEKHYPNLKVDYVLQSVMKGQSDALYLARQYLTGPMIVCFSDTLMETDFSFLIDETIQAVAWVKPVPDPRRFGVAELDAAGWVTRLVEKPTSLENDRVVVGCYYFREGRDLVSAIQEQMSRGISLKGEYFLTDTVNIMLERGLKMSTHIAATWLDTGTIEATLETNRYLLSHLPAGQAQPENQPALDRANVTILPPVFIHPSAGINNSVIGPYTSIGADCRISDARIEDSILEDGGIVEAVALKGSFIGRRARVKGRSASDPSMKLNIGDDSSVILI